MANYVRVGQLHYQGKIISSSGIIADVRRHRRARGPENIRRREELVEKSPSLHALGAFRSTLGAGSIMGALEGVTFLDQTDQPVFIEIL